MWVAALIFSVTLGNGAASNLNSVGSGLFSTEDRQLKISSDEQRWCGASSRASLLSPDEGEPRLPKETPTTAQIKVPIAATTSEIEDQFEREKWKAEKEFRERELTLKEREQHNRDQELNLKREEQAQSKWNTPLIVAIIAAAIAGIANIIAGAINNHLERNIESDKSESTRILEMIKTGDLKKAQENLKFLIDTGLITNVKRVKEIKSFLLNNPNTGPVLPVSGYTIDAIKPLADLVELSLREYKACLERIGFDKPDTDVSIRVTGDANVVPGWLSYYDPNTQTIVIHSAIAAEIDSPRREYTHFVLLHQAHAEEVAQYPEMYLLESDLVDYFVCSFANRPHFGQVVASLRELTTPYLRTLDNQTTFEEATPATTAFQEGREVWGGAFWAIRSSLGAAVTDQLLAVAWETMPAVETGDETAVKFINAVASATHDIASPAASSAIANILRQRDFPLGT